MPDVRSSRRSRPQSGPSSRPSHSAFVSLAAFTLLGMAACSNSDVAAQPAEDGLVRTISVSGEGKASAAPDMATIRFSVETNGKTAKDALAANATRMSAVIGTLNDRGIAEKDIQTSGLNLSIEYQRDANGRYQTQAIAGYRVYNTVTVRLRNVSDVGETVDATISAGANRMDSLYFSFADDTGLRMEARIKAMADARARAELYAREAGVSVGQVLSISEPGSARPGPVMVQSRSFAAEADMSTPVAAGENSLTARVNVVYGVK